MVVFDLSDTGSNIVAFVEIGKCMYFKFAAHGLFHFNVDTILNHTERHITKEQWIEKIAMKKNKMQHVQ